MKVLLSTDIEGITGLEERSLLNRKNPKAYKYPCQLMTDEVNVVIESCFDAGATEVFVVDGHAKGRNIFRDKIDSRAQMMTRDLGVMMMSGVEHVDAVLFVGYHGMAGKEKSFCAHTNSTLVVRSLHIDGVEMSEGMTNALVAKYHDKKVIYASGTDVGNDEMVKYIPNLVTTTNLQSIDMNTAVSEKIPEHYAVIREDVLRAFSQVDSIGFMKGKTNNLSFELKLKHPLLCDIKRVTTKDDGYTVCWTSKSIVSGYKTYRSVIRGAIRSKRKKQTD